MPELYWIDGFPPARIAVADRPRGGDWLAQDMRAYRAAGIDILVSALQPKEQRETWLEHEAAVAAAAGIEFVPFPIGNMLVPQVADALAVFGRLAGEVRAGRAVAAHCHASVGRGPTIVASVLALLGHEPDEIWPRIRLARGLAVPDTDEQRRWVSELAVYSRHDQRSD